MLSDVVNAEIIRSKIQSTTREMQHLLERSAFSTLMRESRDCSFLFSTPAGEHISEGRRYYNFALKNLMAEFTVQPGDVYATNHPYMSGVQHTPDLLVILPVFHGGVHIGFSSSTAHKPDVGGAVVGSASGISTDLFQEGLLIPILKLGTVADGVFELDDNVLRIIKTNVRDPELFMGDTWAQLGVNYVGTCRLAALAELYGTETLLRAYDEILDQGERMMRGHIASWPDGTITVEGFLDSDGIDRERPVRYEMKVTVAGDEITFDCRGSDDQATGPVNMQSSYMEESIFEGLLGMTEPRAAYNGGMRRPVHVLVRDGSVFSPRFPAPVGASTVILHRANDLVLEALSHFVPRNAVANGGGSGGTMAFLWETEGPSGSSRTMQYEVLCTATGASWDHDGCNGISAGTNNRPTTPIEILEAQYPVRIRRFELIEDSGGPGRFRGGLSYLREYECLAPVSLNRRGDREKFPGKGLGGGRDGRRARFVRNPGTDREEAVPGSDTFRFEPGETFVVEGCGAGGYGDPLTRDPAAVAADVRAGFVSRRAATEDYGVVVDDDGSVDAGATDVLRTGRHSLSSGGAPA